MSMAMETKVDLAKMEPPTTAIDSIKMFLRTKTATR